MENRLVDLSILQNLVNITSPQDLVRGYILACRCEGKSPKTISGYENVLKNFLWFCERKSFHVLIMNQTQLREFLWYVASEPNRWGIDNPSSRNPARPATVHKYYRVVGAFFRWLEREHLLHDNPFVYLKAPRMDRRVIQALTVDDIERLFAACSGKTALDIRNKAILSVFLDTGLRVSELASLNLDDIDNQTGAILVKHGKGKKQRIAHIGSKAQKALWRYLLVRKSDSNRLFINRRSDPLDAVGIKILTKRLGQKANVKVHPHKLRHTFAISYLRAGGDVFSLQYLLGHTTLQMTQRYLQSLNADDAIAAHKRFSPLDNMSLSASASVKTR
jgi:site-specific recombinase XerD